MQAADPLIGTQLGHFRVEKLIAEGGMGLIYQATHTVIGRKAAIKVLSEKYSSDKNMIKRLHREARAVNRIGHPNIIDIFDFGQTPDNREYFVMEYLPGQSLAQIQERERRVAWRLAEPILQQTLDALAAAHDLGIIHRDIKPENILVVPQDGGGVVVKILDFGIAKSVGLGPEGERLTRAGSVMGTPEYIAPEQIRGREVDGRADLYAVGVILFEMVMGRRPYESDKVINLLMMHLRDPIPAMEGIPAELGVPRFVPAVVQKAMAKEPGQRFPDARTFARALGLETAAVAPSDGTRPLPELFWEKAEQAVTEEEHPGAGAPPPLATGASPAFPTYEHARMTGGAPGISTELVADEPRAPRSPLRWVIPLAVLLLSAAAIIFYFALRPGKTQPIAAGTGSGSGTAAGTGSGTGAAPAARPAIPKEVDLPALADSVRRTLRAGLTNTVADVRRLAVTGTGLLRGDDALAVLTSRLKDDVDLGVRAAAARAIATLSDPAGAAVLREVRSSADEMTKVTLDSALQRLGFKDGEIGLRDALKSADENVRLSAALALAEAGDAAARAILEAAASDEKKVSTPAGFAAIRGALAKLGHTASHEKLASALLENNLAVKLSAAEALARLGDDDARSTLKQLLTSTTTATSVRLVAAKMLAALGDYSGQDALSKGIEEKDPEAKRLAADGLGAVSDKSSLPLLAYALEDQSWMVKATAAEALARILSQMPTAMIQRSQDWLKNALASGDWSVRHAAVGVTSEMDPELALSLIGRAYNDKDERVRRVAVAQLERVSAEKALPILKHALATDASPEVRATAARILGKVKDQSAKEALQVAAKTDKSNAVRAAVAGSLLAQGDTGYVEQLKAAAKSQNAELKKQAISALGKWDDAEAEKLLTAALKDKNAGVRFAAAYQLAMRGKASGAAELKKALGKGGEEEEQSLRALASLGIKPTGELATLAGSSSAEGRRTAMEGAGMLEPKAALPILKRGASDGDVKIRLAAARSLARMADKEAKTLPLLRVLAKDSDPTVRAAAELGLAKAAKAGAALDMGKVTPVEPPPPLPPVPDKKIPTPPPDKKGQQATEPAPLFVDEKFVRFQHLTSQATAAMTQRRYAVAIKLLRQAQKLGDKPSIPFDLGFAHLEIARGKKASDKAGAKALARQAKAYFTAYLGRHPNGPLARRARGGLEDCKNQFGLR